jgi:hypothetical protein
MYAADTNVAHRIDVAVFSPSCFVKDALCRVVLEYAAILPSTIAMRRPRESLVLRPFSIEIHRAR